MIFLALGEARGKQMFAPANARRRAGAWFCTLCTGMAVLAWTGSVTAQDASPQPVAAAPERNAPRAQPAIALVDGMLSVSLNGAELSDVLETIARRADLEVRVSARVRDATVTDAFENLPLDEGLRQLLRGMNYSLVYSGDGPGRSLRKVIVISSRVDQWEAEADAHPASRAEASDAVADAAPQQVVQEFEKLLGAGGRAEDAEGGRLQTEDFQGPREFEEAEHDRLPPGAIWILDTLSRPGQMQPEENSSPAAELLRKLDDVRNDESQSPQ